MGAERHGQQAISLSLSLQLKENKLFNSGSSCSLAAELIKAKRMKWKRLIESLKWNSFAQMGQRPITPTQHNSTEPQEINSINFTSFN